MSALLARMIANDLHAESVGPLVPKMGVPQAVVRNALDTTASLVSLASISLASFHDARTLSLYATLLGLLDAATVPGGHRSDDPEHQRDLEPVAGEKCEDLCHLPPS